MEVIPKGYKQTEVGVIPEDWSVRCLKEICSKVTDGTHDTPKPVKSGVPFLTAIHVKDNHIDYSCCLYVTKEDHEIIYKRCNPEKGDVLVVNIGAGVATSALVDVDYEFSLKNVALLKPSTDRLSGAYLNYCLSYKKPAITQALSSGGAQPFLSLTQIGEISIPMPLLPEQRAIASALSDVDALLAKLDQLIAKKRDLKQAAMQQLITGQTRLPGFSGAWEVKRLGEIGKCLRGVSYRGDADLSAYDTNETKRLLRSNNVQDAAVVTTDLQFVNSERVSEYQLLRQRDILICMANGSKALVGKAGFFTVRDGYEYTFGAFMGCFRSNSTNADALFVFYQFQTERYRNYINNLLAGSSINNLTPTSVESLEFSMPVLPEQTAIATVLSDIDAELAALEARRDKTHAFKQGMMQELLTGRIRLV